MLRIVLVAAGLSLTLLAGCVEPLVTKEMVPLGQVNLAGKECRRENDPGTNIPKTVCADPRVWAHWDAEQKAASDDLHEYSQRQGTPFKRGD